MNLACAKTAAREVAKHDDTWRFFLQAVEYLPELSRQIRRLCSSDFRLPLLLPLLPAMLSGILHAALRQGSQGDVAGVKVRMDTTPVPGLTRPRQEASRRHHLNIHLRTHCSALA